MSQKVDYSTWPECQVMLDCIHHRTVNDDFNSCICMKEGKCTCLQKGETLPEDKLEELTDEPD